MENGRGMASSIARYQSFDFTSQHLRGFIFPFAIDFDFN